MAEILFELQKEGIFKKVLYGGDGNIPTFPDGAKATFHYRTTKANDDRTVLDDSKHTAKPMELIFGKKFKLEVWEKLLKTMKVNEVAEFTCDTKARPYALKAPDSTPSTSSICWAVPCNIIVTYDSPATLAFSTTSSSVHLVNRCTVVSWAIEQCRQHTAVYPLVAKSLRDIYKGKSSHTHTSHCCGMMALSEQGMGYSDLDELMKSPQPLVFILELLKLELPEQFEKESWSMNEFEKLESIPKLREIGNEAYNQKNYEEAANKYAQALGMLEDLMLQEKPGDEEWKKLDQMKRPLLLNFSQCKLLTHDYYPVITHTSDVLDREPDNVKALFRRGKAHAAVWNLKEAHEDFARVVELDSSLKKAVAAELASLEQRVKEKEKLERSLLQGMFS